MTSPASRVALFRKSLGLGQKAFAVTLGTSPATIGMVESGAQPPSRRFLGLLSERYGVSADWLLYGHEPMIQPSARLFPSGAAAIEPPDVGVPLPGDFRSEGQDFALIRVFAVRASAGHGLAVDDEAVTDRIAFSRAFLLRHNLSPDLCGLVRAAGLSMEPLIPDGALMLADFTARADLRDGVHIFGLGDDLYVKRLTVLDRDGFGRPTRIL